MVLLGRTLNRAKNKLVRLPFIDELCYLLSVRKLRGLSEDQRIVSPEKELLEAYEFSGYGRYNSIKPGQNPTEIIELANIVADSNIDSIMEIGTARGGTLYLWNKIFSDLDKIISLDLPKGKFGGGYSSKKVKFFQDFSENNLECIRANSHSNEVKEEIKQLVGPQGIDFLFIDGDHTYEGVKQDFEMYQELVSDGGIIAFHDIRPHPNHSDVEVHRFWEEVKQKYEYKEIVADGDQEWAGIGVIFL